MKIIIRFWTWDSQWGQDWRLGGAGMKLKCKQIYSTTMTKTNQTISTCSNPAPGRPQLLPGPYPVSVQPLPNAFPALSQHLFSSPHWQFCPEPFDSISNRSATLPSGHQWSVPKALSVCHLPSCEVPLWEHRGVGHPGTLESLRITFCGYFQLLL